MTTTIAIERLTDRVVKRLLAGIDLRLAVGLGESCRIPDGDTLGIELEPLSHGHCSFRPASRHRAGRAFASLQCPRNFFAGTSHESLEVPAPSPRCVSEAGGRA